MDFPQKRWISLTLCPVNSGTVITSCPTKAENLGQGELKGGMWIRGVTPSLSQVFPLLLHARDHAVVIGQRPVTPVRIE